MGRIVVGIDGSAKSMAAFRWAAGEAVLRNATLVAVHAWTHPYLATPIGVAPVGPIDDDTGFEAQAAAVIDDAVAGLGSEYDVSIERRVVEGSATSVLLAAAADADLLVVGSRGHGGVVGLLLGSVSNHVAQHSLCPVVIIPDPGDDSARLPVGD